MPVVVFDLDDTLYDEITFVKSGFRAVADFLEKERGMDRDICYEDMLVSLTEQGRGHVFDALLLKHGCFSKRLTRQCLAVYRSHDPDIVLNEDAARFLDELGDGYSIYIVTDGNKHVQFNKLKSLRLIDHHSVRRCFISRRYGIYNEKPSPYCFYRICKIEQTDPHNVVYIGDNPNKDFVGIKPLGFRTIRILRGHYAELRKPPEYEAEMTINDLYNLGDILRQLFH